MCRIMNSGIVIAFIGLVSIFSGAGCNKPSAAGCVTCDTELTNTCSMVASAVKGMEPICQEDINICKIVEVRGVHTVKYNNKSCLKEQGKAEKGKCYSQMFELKFGEVKVGCKLNQNPMETVKILGQTGLDAGKAAVGAAGDAAKDLTKKLPKIGKRSDHNAGSFFVNSSWANFAVRVDMHICFDDDIYNLTTASIIDTKFGGLKIWCEGGSLIDTCCSVFTGNEVVRSLLGQSVKWALQLVFPKLLNDKTVMDALGTLNCGIQYDD